MTTNDPCGESGPRARPCDVSWVRSIVQQCHAASVPCFVKQLGANPFSRVADGTMFNDYKRLQHGWEVVLRDRKGGNPDEWDERLRIREFPEGGTHRT